MSDDQSHDISTALEGLARSYHGELYVVLDAARCREVPTKLRQLGVAARPLFVKEPIPAGLESALPHLAPCPLDSELMRWMLDSGWGDAWGIFLVSPVDLDTLAHHLMGHLHAELEDGQRLIFRFYDPRVLRAFLPTCTEEQSDAFFGPIEAIGLEGEDGALQILDRA